jgi:hypothetical protein
MGQTRWSVPQISEDLSLRGDSLFGKQVRRHFAEVPHDPEPGEHLQRVVSDVDLPPVEALARRGHEVMMVVVPAFAERQQRQQPVVLAGVGGFIAPRTEEVRERIDRKRIVPEHHGAEAEAPYEQRPSADEHQRGAQGDRRHQMIFVQPAQLGIFGKIPDVVDARVVVLVRNDPADVRPEKPEQRRRVQIQFLIRIPVMVPVMRRPPQHALLRGGRRDKGDHKLEYPAGLERAVRKIAVVARGHEKHAHQKNTQAGEEIRPVKMNEKYPEGKNVNQYKRQGKQNRYSRAIRQRD